jgi:hypothetical protein
MTAHEGPNQAPPVIPEPTGIDQGADSWAKRRAPGTWQQVASALAARLARRAKCNRHPNPEDGDPDVCPFCADRDAYLRWQAKAGT